MATGFGAAGKAVSRVDRWQVVTPPRNPQELFSKLLALISDGFPGLGGWRVRTAAGEDGGRRSWEDDGEARLRARHRLTTSRTFACGLKSNAFKDWGAKLRTRPVCLLPHPAEGLRRSDARDSIQGKSVWSITHPAKGREDREPNRSARCGTEHAGAGAKRRRTGGQPCAPL